MKFSDSTVTPIQGREDEAHGQVIESDSLSDLYLHDKLLDARPKTRKPRRQSERSRDRDPAQKGQGKKGNKREDSK